ncbi:MAG: right-handed parallel beta-helix repeat-containing protein, partial [Deltaproteobacteria bacterium]|nr:right-handed parallel beta-helix repeat-containing protein [Deltaproteobacteria bacterium]
MKAIFHALAVGAVILFFGCPPSFVFAATALVPTLEYPTIQEAVDAVQNDADPGEVIINSDSTFVELLTIKESVTLRAGDGFAPVITFAGAFAPLTIRATQNANTEVVVRGISVRLENNHTASYAVAIINTASDVTKTLDVTLNGLRIVAKDAQNAISIASVEITGPITFTLLNSDVELVGENAGDPSCLRLEPYKYDLTSIIRNNTFRFLNAGGIRIAAPANDFMNSATIDANVFEGIVFNTDEGRYGVRITGPNSAQSDKAETEAVITNNLFLRTGHAIGVNGILSQVHSLVANNNTIVENKEEGLFPQAQGSSMVLAAVANNIIAGSLGFGIKVEEADAATVNLTGSHNLLFDNAMGDYSGADPGPGDLSVDPKFVNPGADNYRLGKESPAIDQGTNNPSGGLGSGSDLDGHTRIQDGNSDGSAVVDMGAYEYESSTALAANGIWKDPTNQTHNFYIQHYSTGATVVIYTKDAVTFFAFLANISGSTFETDSLDPAQARRMRILFTSNDQALATITDYTNNPPVSFDVPIHKEFDALRTQHSGIWKDESGLFNLYVQDYKTGSTVMVYTFNGVDFQAFLGDITLFAFSALNLADQSEELGMVFAGPDKGTVTV